MKNKIPIKIICCLVILTLVFLSVTSVFGASEPELVKKLNTAFTNIKKWLVKLATPAAGIAIASGVLMRKFSFGDDEKMLKGKKVIINAVICYAIILSIDLILKFVDTVI